MIDEFLTTIEISKILKSSPEFVYKHAKELGGIKIGKLVRFSKIKFQEIMGGMSNGDLQTQREMDVRFLEKRGKIQEGRISGQTRCDRSGSKDKKYNQSDKYGFRAIMREQVDGDRDETK